MDQKPEDNQSAMPTPPARESGSHKKLFISVAAIILLAAAAVAGYIIWQQNTQNQSKTTGAQTQSPSPVSIPQKILDNKFGFLGGGADDKGEAIVETGAAWVRPHPGPFVWDMMQPDKTSSVSFTDADAQITNYQTAELGTLATLWPFAEWDQQASTSASSCKVSDNDQFLQKNDSKGRGSYLPAHRCNPSDWQAYQKWITAVIERYDGDGTNDMPGLKVPVKYWEVMNEPDLSWQPGPGSDTLTFYKQGPDQYGELLKQTYAAIKAADPNAQVLIAGAAGGNEQFLSFYEKALAGASDIKNYFDIGNVHCISNDQDTHDFNVGAYKTMLAKAGITKPIWVTEAEAMYGKTADQNYQNTRTSTAGAIAAGAQRVFYTRYQFDDTRTDMSQKSDAGIYPSAQKYQDIFGSFE